MAEALGCTRKTGPAMAVRFRLTHLTMYGSISLDSLLFVLVYMK